MNLLKIKSCSGRTDCPCITCYETRVSKTVFTEQNQKVCSEESKKWKVEWCYTRSFNRTSKVITEFLPLVSKLKLQKWYSTSDILKVVEQESGKSIGLQTLRLFLKQAVLDGKLLHEVYGKVHFWKLI